MNIDDRDTSRISDFNKVLQGLCCCTSEQKCCYKCPYTDSCYDEQNASEVLLKDALKLLETINGDTQ